MSYWVFAGSSSSHTVRRLVPARTPREESASAHSYRCMDLRAEVPLHTGKKLNACCASARHESLGTCLTPSLFLGPHRRQGTLGTKFRKRLMTAVMEPQTFQRFRYEVPDRAARGMGRHAWPANPCWR